MNISKKEINKKIELLFIEYEKDLRTASSMAAGMEEDRMLGKISALLFFGLIDTERYSELCEKVFSMCKN